MRHLSGITVSVGYSDFLSWGMAANRGVFDRLVVVTSPADTATQEVCAHNWVECLVTDAMYADGQVFNKGAAIQAGLERLDAPDWVIHYDGDIVFPPRAGELLRAASLNDQFLYGCDRMMVPGFDAWASFLTRPCRQHYRGSAWPAPFPVGYRAVYDGDGYLPIGYFQMFNANSAHLGTPAYPRQFDSAADSDIHFAMQYPKANRALFPDMFLYHLDSEAKPGEVGANWSGRTTRVFGPGG